jgi:hypothetical protein
MLRTKKRKWRDLQEAVRQDDTERVRSITGGLAIDHDLRYYEACKLALQHDTSETLKALLEAGKGFNFFAEGDYLQHPYNETYGKSLVQAALSSPAAVSHLSALYEANQITECGKLHHVHFLTTDMPAKIIQTVLEEHRWAVDYLDNIGQYSTEQLKAILTAVSGFPDPQPVLDEALVKTSARGDVEKAELLLDFKADANYLGGMVLEHAAEGGYQDMVDLLLRHINADLCSYIFTEFQQKEGISPGIMASIAVAAGKTVAAPPAPETSGYALADADTLVRMRTMPDGSTMTITYDFRIEERIITVVANDGQTPPGITTRDFSDIKKEIIEDRRRELAALNKKPARPDYERLRL